MATWSDTNSSTLSRKSLVYPWLWIHDVESGTFPELLSLHWFMHEFGDAASVCHTHIPQTLVEGHSKGSWSFVVVSCTVSNSKTCGNFWRNQKTKLALVKTPHKYFHETPLHHSWRCPLLLQGSQDLWGLCWCLSNICDYGKPLHNA